jgi:hypothetical protein
MNHYSMERLGQERTDEMRDWARRSSMGRKSAASRPSHLTRFVPVLRAVPHLITSRVATVAVRIGVAARG